MAVVVIFAGTARLLRQGRPNFVKLSAARVFEPLAQISALMMVVGPLSYLIESLRMPLVDRSLRTIDAALGFNWRSLTDFILSNRAITQILGHAYLSIPWQLVVILTICSVGANPRESEFAKNYVLSIIICVVIGGMLPALGEPSPLQAVFRAQFAEVRSGHWQVLDYRAMQGLVAFPSFHTAFPIIAVYAVRHSLLAVLGVGVVNLLMLLSIPTFGGHYLTDMIGGAVVAIASILCTSPLGNWGTNAALPVPNLSEQH
jgi:hypothetical protein